MTAQPLSFIYPIVFMLLFTATSAIPAQAGEQKNLSREYKREMITARLRYYQQQYPDIHFLHAEGGSDWRSELVAIFSLLGEEASYLDYQHPPQMRDEMFHVSLARLARMLEHDIVSASLYAIGQHSLIDRPRLCIITLNLDSFASNDHDATHYMLDMTDEQMEPIHPARLLDARQHLLFTIDHEAYHCIDSHLHGGAPMTQKQFGGEYNLFRRESAADAYALAVHLREHKRLTPYARNITHIRALWLFSDGPNRCTFESMTHTLNTDIKKLSAMTERQLIALVNQVRDLAVGNYDFYVHQRAAAYQAAQQLILNPSLYGKIWQQLDEIKTDPREVRYKVQRYHYYHDRLFDEKPIEFKPAAASSLTR